MGNCSNMAMINDEAYSALRNSLLGSLIPDTDFPEFYRSCQAESNTMSNTLRISLVQSFYVVASGEVIAMIGDNESDPVVAAVYKPGDIIFFFPIHGVVCNGGSFSAGKHRLVFQFRATGAAAQVVGADRASLARFLQERPHLTDLHRFVNTDLNAFLSLPGFKDISAPQLSMLAPLLKFKRCQEGQIIKMSHGSQPPDSLSLSKKVKTAKDLMMPVLEDQWMGLLLDGTCAAMPPSTNLPSLAWQLLSRPSLPPVGEGPPEATGQSAPPPSPPSSPLKVLSAMIPGRHVEKEADESGLDVEGVEEIIEDSEIYPGSVIGLEKIFIDNNNCILDSIVAIEPVVLGYLEWDSVKALFTVDPVLKRSLRKNYHQRIIDTVKQASPMLRDLNERIYASMCSKVILKGYHPGEEIFREGASSICSYIIIQGTVEERQRADASLVSKAQVADVRYLGPGSLFGEASLVTDSPYFSSTKAVEPTIVVCISKYTLDMMYNKEKAKLAELRIRLAGVEADLEAVLMHPTGNRLFYEFLKKEMAAENILFYNAATKFDEMCERVKKAFVQVAVHHWQVLARERRTEEDRDVGFDDAAAASGEAGSWPPARQLSVDAGAHGASAAESEPFSGVVTEYSSKNLVVGSHDSAEPPPDGAARAPRSEEHALAVKHKAQIEQKVSELKEVAKHITEKYVHYQAYCEINVSEKIRVNAEQLFAEWQQRSNASIVEEMIEVALRNHQRELALMRNARHSMFFMGGGPDSAEPDLDKLKPRTLPSLNAEQLDSVRLTAMGQGVPNDPGPAPLVLPYHRLFSPAKAEVFRLMNDPFLRFRKVATFVAFVAGIKPYEKNEATGLETSLRSVQSHAPSGSGVGNGGRRSKRLVAQNSASSWRLVAGGGGNAGGGSGSVNLYVSNEERSARAGGGGASPSANYINQIRNSPSLGAKAGTAPKKYWHKFKTPPVAP